MRTRMITVFAFALSLVLVTGLIAEDKLVLPHSVLLEQEFTPDYSKPGGIVIGPAMPRAFHYGGRHTVRDVNGILHATWEDPTYDFNYYAHSLDTLGLEWTEPINPHSTYGIVLEDGSLLYELDRALMAKMAIDPKTGYLYMVGFHRRYAGERYKTGITRSTDNGATWAPYIDLGAKINRPTEEVSWATFTIGYDPDNASKTIMHIAYSKGNVDIMYTRADLSVIDAASADLNQLVFTQSDGVTTGDQAISYVPSGTVFQGTIVLDRNKDPHVIFSGDGGADTFGDKTPYHIYFKSEVDAWGPIPPTQLQAELTQCWGMPEMVFDQDNRGYYFLDNNPGDFTFGTWEPPLDPSSTTDFGTLNGTGSVAGFADAVDLTDANFANLAITDADNLYLPQADVDDANDVVYVAGNTNARTGGDLVILALENASQYSNTTGPSAMDWVVYRWVTSDGISLSDVGADMVYDPSSSKIDIFWAGAGATDLEAQYLGAHIPPPAVDAQAVSISIVIPDDKPEANKNDVIAIRGIVKNNGTQIIPPVPVVAMVLDTNGVALFTGNYNAPPLSSGAQTPEIEFGQWTVEGDGQTYSVTLSVELANDEASYNNLVGTSFFAYPDTATVFGYENWDDTLTFTNIPVVDQEGVQIISGFAGGWTVVDSSNGPFEDARDDYIATWFFDDDDNNELDQYAYVRHLQGVRNDTIYGDIVPPLGYDDSTYAQPQNELLYSPFYSLGDDETLADSVQIRFQWKNPNNDGSFATWGIDNVYVVARGTEVILNFDELGSATLDPGDTHYPLTANIDLSIDGGETWLPVLHREATLDATPDDMEIDYFDDFADLDITSLVTTYVGIDGEHIVPREYALSQNYPNPFNPLTMIRFSIPEATHVRLDVFNLMGQKVETLLNGYLVQGQHKVGFDASNLQSGIYFYTLKTSDRTITKKMILLK